MKGWYRSNSGGRIGNRVADQSFASSATKESICSLVRFSVTATSNICTNQSLLALCATIYLSLLGKKGLRRVAELCLQKAHYLADRIAGLPGWQLAWPNRPFFREFVVVPPVAPEEVIDRLLEKNILAGIDLGRQDKKLAGKLLVAVT